MTSRRQTRKEILYDLVDFATVAVDKSLIRLSFFLKRDGDFVLVQPRLFYPAEDRIVIWEGPNDVFSVFDEDGIRKFQEEQVSKIKESLGFAPTRGRWET